MSRMLRTCASGLLALGVAAVANLASAQEAADDKAGPGAKRERPDAEALRIEELPKELEAVLKAWELASSKIQRLQGEHKRYVYDKVFNVEKRADGIFYYEAPDKGRIDIAPAKIAKGEASKRLDPKSQKPFKLEADREERWICTGKEILQINDQEKTYEMYPIPPQHQGANIMEGPLPFLFGMPADKAKKRFKLTLVAETPVEVRLHAIPRWKSDAEGYREAEIILDKTQNRYLPKAVRLIDPSGNLETVYQFVDLQLNKRELFPAIWGKDPFHPPMKGYRLTMTQPPQTAGQPPRGRPTENPGGEGPKTALEVPQPGAAPTGPAVPSVVGFSWTNAEAILKKSGYTVKFKRGQPAAAEKLVFVVYDQTPKARTELKPGETVYLTLYDKQAVAGGGDGASRK